LSNPTIVVIGSGPGGLSAVRTLTASGKVRVTLLQKGGFATFLPGIVPILLGLHPATTYQHQINMPDVRVITGEASKLEAGQVYLADGSMLQADAVIAAPGLATDPTAIPAGPRTFAIWEIEAAAVAQKALSSLVEGRVVIGIASLPYRCPPAPYGLAIALKALVQAQGKAIDVVLTTPESRPLQSLDQRVSDYLVSLLRAGNVELLTGFQFDNNTCGDGLLVATDGRQLSYDLGLFVSQHRRPAILADLPGTGAMVQVDAQQRTALQNLWVIGDVAGSPLPRAAGVAEAQGRTAAESVLATLGLGNFTTPTIPSPNCYVWTGLSSAGRIQLRFPQGLPPTGKPEAILDEPNTSIFEEAIRAAEQWKEHLHERV
jgi:sulfide:quinone oxidoreductase